MLTSGIPGGWLASAWCGWWGDVTPHLQHIQALLKGPNLRLPQKGFQHEGE